MNDGNNYGVLTLVTRFFAAVVIISNLYWGYVTFNILSHNEGLGWIVLPFTGFAHLLLIPAIASFRKQEVSLIVFFTNCIGGMLTGFFAWMFFTY